jgi:hypothetical protein
MLTVGGRANTAQAAQADGETIVRGASRPTLTVETALLKIGIHFLSSFFFEGVLSLYSLRNDVETRMFHFSASSLVIEGQNTVGRCCRFLRADEDL